LFLLPIMESIRREGTIHLILTVMVRSEARKEIYMKEVSVLRSSFNGRELFHKG
jgi:Arylsulfatase A and related enzymes